MALSPGGFGVASRAALQRPQTLTGSPATSTLKKATAAMGGTDAMGIGTALQNPQMTAQSQPFSFSAGYTPSASAPATSGQPAKVPAPWEVDPSILSAPKQVQDAIRNAYSQNPQAFATAYQAAGVGPTAANVANTTDLTNRYNALTDNTGNALDQSYGAYQGAYGDFGNAIDRFTGAAANVGAYQPTNTMGVGNAIGSDFSRYTPQTMDSLNLGQYLSQAGASGAMQGVDFSNIENFDPSSAINQYATGAWGSIKADLGDQLDNIRNQDARLGRLNTGFFDKDRGTVINRATDQFNNQLAQTAVQGAGLKLNALTSAGGLNLSKAQAIDAATRAGGASGLGAALQLAGMNESGRQFDVGQDYTRQSGTNAFNLGKANYIDTALQNAGNNAAGYYGQAAGYAGQRAGMAQGQYNTDYGNYAGLVSGGLDRDFQNRQFTAQNNQVNQQNQVNKKGNTLSAIGTGAAIGSRFGPWGAGIGAALGGISSLF